ncbi:hypothetical protein A2U01_0110499, partial [Trifolium medium]|nr:hypothetical protein [Trifolium medium]
MMQLLLLLLAQGAPVSAQGAPVLMLEKLLLLAVAQGAPVPAQSATRA